MKLPHEDLTTEAKRAYILFAVLRCGTEYVDISLLHRVGKKLAGDDGYDEGGGVPASPSSAGDDAVLGNRNLRGSAERPRKRRRDDPMDRISLDISRVYRHGTGARDANGKLDLN